MKVDFYWHSYKYLPYEQELAIRELNALFGQEPIPGRNSLSIASSNGWKIQAQRMTYFREVIAEDGSHIVPLQATLEASNGSRIQPRLFDMPEGLPSTDLLPAQFYQQNRQSTRYSAHGLHEYRGKFNPQIVRAIGNILGLKPGSWILDPFVGSGTTLLEAAHISWNAIGVDINPLGVQIAQAKIVAMQVPEAELQTCAEELGHRLEKRFTNISFDRPFTESEFLSIGGKDWEAKLPGFAYLCLWFTKSVLVQLEAILEEIAYIPSASLQLIFRIILSDILREVSLQDPEDLRIRRRKFPSENYSAVPIYIECMKNKIWTILQARQYLSDATTTHEAILGDSRFCDQLMKEHSDFNAVQFDGAITSPPYATALPYIDTQRLSLVFLDLIQPNNIRTTEKSLTGNREITSSERLRLETAINKNTDNLPTECIVFCRKLKAALDSSNDGFRRQNVPALVYQYLVDMALMFKHVYPLLRDNAPFALVIGKNQTVLGKQLFVIDTPHLLTLIAEQNGFHFHEALALNTYQRYSVHQENSIRSEILLVLRKGKNAYRSHSTN